MARESIGLLFIQELRSELRTRFKGKKLTAEALTFFKFKPQDTLDITEVARYGWTSRTFSDPNNWDTKFRKTSQGIVHVVVLVENRETEHVEDGDELLDEVHPLENLRFERALSSRRNSPSEGSKPREYAKTQADPDSAIYDGLRAPQERAPLTLSSPLPIFHPIFHNFIRNVNDPTLKPPPDFLQLVLDFMRDASKIRVTNQNCVEYVEKDGVTVAPCHVEFKRLSSEDGCDMTIQCCNSMRASLLDKTRKKLVLKCNCPTFMIAIGGAWMVVMGGAFTDRFITQKLTDMLWIAPNSTHDDLRIHKTAKVLFALKKALHELKEFYIQLPTDQIPEYNTAEPHPRNFPYPASYPKDGETVLFKALEKDEAQCVTYLAKEKESREEVVVKYVTTYGEDVHRFLADKGHAPALRYCGPLPASTTQQVGVPFGNIAKYPETTDSTVALAEEMQMVVMDFAVGRKEATGDVRTQLEEILNLLHEAGYVFGDLRRQNVMFKSSDGTPSNPSYHQTTTICLVRLTFKSID
ncbi:hypothetical protein V5O48_009805 [Marasmius crinis-equi]|uniref:Protein kinase domain-containing protein n=1 Tax=Marasmius crinis-equi TaxID=585013 RepID=A0ABR3FAN4_9AGAR